MWKLFSTLAAIMAVLFIINKIVDKWLSAPNIDFNKMYDKTML
jgi:hypothetical protein